MAKKRSKQGKKNKQMQKRANKVKKVQGRAKKRARQKGADNGKKGKTKAKKGDIKGTQKGRGKKRRQKKNKTRDKHEKKKRRQKKHQKKRKKRHKKGQTKGTKQAKKKKQKGEAKNDEIPPLSLCPSAILPSFVFRADTLCCWNDGSVLSRFLLRKHCRVGTFIRIDLSPCCSAAHSICSIQSCLVSMRPCTLVSWLKPLHPSHLELWFFQPCHHTRISSCLGTENARSPLRSRTIARTQRVINTLCGSGAISDRA